MFQGARPELGGCWRLGGATETSHSLVAFVSPTHQGEAPGMAVLLKSAGRTTEAADGFSGGSGPGRPGREHVGLHPGARALTDP